MVLRLLHALGLDGGHQRHDALAIRREIDVLHVFDAATDLLFGPLSRFPPQFAEEANRNF